MGYRRVVLLVACTAALAFGEVRSPEVIWVDSDMENISEPRERDASELSVYLKALVTGQVRQALDIPRWGRALVGKPKPAANINALDEVPSSSWYTNRHHLRRMTLDELARGPNPGSGPDFSQVVITDAKTRGVTPGLRLKDNKGDVYLVKFDHKDYPELQSGAEVVSTKILHAAGYNVPENYIAYLDIDRVQIDKDFQMSGKPFSREDLDRMLEPVARLADGRYRVLASKILAGKPKGPFPQVGLRRDDPNDLIPHEHRRELRGLRVIASWINHWDMKETNSLDMYVEENGRRFLRHYLIDFGSTLGGAQEPLKNSHGQEYVFDIANIFKELATGSIYTGPGEKRIQPFSPAMGIFRAQDFDPGDWKPSVNVIPNENLTDEDAFWSTRIILSFTESELRSIIETAEYTDHRDTEYLLHTLLERQRLVASHWLKKVNPITDFSAKGGQDGVDLRFRDLIADSNLTAEPPAGYTYQIKRKRFTSTKHTTPDTMIKLNRHELRAAFGEDMDETAPVEIVIWSNRPGSVSDSVRIHLYNALEPANVRIGRIVRS